MKLPLTFQLNGAEVAVMISPDSRLIDVLRDQLSQTGTKEGCSEGECGACSVIFEGRIVASCLLMAAEVQGATVVTIEGVRDDKGKLSPVQQAFLDRGGAQCGFCTPGMILATIALLKHTPQPTDEEIRSALTGNLCRCTGYVQIIDSIRRASETYKDAEP